MSFIVLGDALLTAACVCYHGALDNRTRADLMSDWLSRCELGNFDPSLRLGKQVKAVSLSARLDTLMKSGSVPSATAAAAGMQGTDSVHSIQQADSYPAADGVSNRGKHAPPPSITHYMYTCHTYVA